MISSEVILCIFAIGMTIAASIFLRYISRESPPQTPIPFRHVGLPATLIILWIGAYILFDYRLLISIQYAVFYSCLIILFITDIEYMHLPPIITISLIGCGLIFAALDRVFFAHLISASTGFTIFFVFGVIGKWLYNKDSLGSGDMLLAAAFGAFWGMHIMLLALYLSVVIGALIGLLAIFVGKKHRHDTIPFAPAMIFAIPIAQLGKDTLTSWLLP